MIGDVTWKANGIDIDTALGAVLVDSTTIRPEVIARQSLITIPGQHGAIMPGLPVYEPATVALGIYWQQNTQTTLEEKVNQAHALFTQPSLTLTRVSGSLETYATARLTSLSPNGFLVNQMESAIATFTIPGVFFRTTSSDSSAISFAGDLTNTTLSILAGSTGPVADATIRVTGPCLNPQVTNPTSGTGLYYSGMVAYGEYLFMSSNQLKARISTSSTAWSSGGTDVTANLDWPSTGRLQFWPVVQTATTRTMLFSATGSSRVSGQTYLTFRGQRSYL